MLVQSTKHYPLDRSISSSNKSGKMIGLRKIHSAFICLLVSIVIIFLIISITELGIPQSRSALNKTLVDYKYCYNDSMNSIIFFHLTNESNEWKQLEACAFKRAAELNGIGVCVLTTTTMAPHRALVGLANLEFAPLDIERIITGTSVYDWYVNIYSNKYWYAIGKLDMYGLSDGLRWSYLYNFGGYYLDTDVIALQNFTHLRNTTAWEQPNSLGVSILFFDKGHPLIKTALDLIQSTYNGKAWGTIGPPLLTRIVRHGNVSNDTYHVLRKELYPTAFWDYTMPFSKSSKESMKKMAKRSYTLHLWRRMFSTKDLILSDGSFIEEICGDV